MALLASQAQAEPVLRRNIEAGMAREQVHRYLGVSPECFSLGCSQVTALKAGFRNKA